MGKFNSHKRIPQLCRSTHSTVVPKGPICTVNVHTQPLGAPAMADVLKKSPLAMFDLLLLPPHYSKGFLVLAVSCVIRT